MRLLYILVLLFLSTTTFSQSSFNYQKDFPLILARSKNASDSLFYNRLLARFTANDSTLTNHEVIALLIGFTDKPAYQPYKDIETETLLNKQSEDGKYQLTLEKATDFLKTHPVNMEAIKEMEFALNQLGLRDSAALYAYRLSKITSAMLSTGNGKSAETARFALGPKDGQYLLRNAKAPIATTSSGYDKNGNLLDIVAIKVEITTPKPFFFIIQHAAAKMYEGFSKEELKKIQKKKK